MAHERSSTASPLPVKKPRVEDDLVEADTPRVGEAAAESQTTGAAPAPLDVTNTEPAQGGPSLNAAAAGSPTQHDSATHQPAPRVIDETTDMTTLTDQEIMQLMEGMGQEDVTSKVGHFRNQTQTPS